MVNIKLLFIILDEGNDNKVKNILNKFGIKVKTVTNVSGTASPSVLDYFGLTETKKELFIAIIPDYLNKKIITKIKTSFNLGKEGTGIAFTIPIASSNKYLSDSFSKHIKEKDESNMENKNEIKYHLIVTIVLEGYLEQVMNAAKRAGCSGGTVIKGRELSDNRKVKILGFNIEPERDIVINLVSENEKNKVMEEITKEVGIKTKGKGMCLSLPIDDVVGLELSK